MTSEINYSLIPKDFVIKGGIERIKEQKAKKELHRKVFTEFTPIVAGSTEKNGLIKVKKIKEGTLYFSGETFVADKDGNLIPRALLVTDQGRDLVKTYPDVLRTIDEGKTEERKPTLDPDGKNEGASGVVSIINFSDGTSLAVKRFKRYEDGRRFEIGGLELAQISSEFENGPMKDIARFPKVYFASQDVLVMENLEGRESINDFLKTHRELLEKFFDDLNEINSELIDIITRTKSPGRIEAQLRPRIFIDSFEPPANIKYVLLDPIA